MLNYQSVNETCWYCGITIRIYPVISYIARLEMAIKIVDLPMVILQFAMLVYQRVYLSGWWFGTCFMTFHSVGNVIIPTDEVHHFSD